jgi:hypothetical protein
LMNTSAYPVFKEFLALLFKPLYHIAGRWGLALMAQNVKIAWRKSGLCAGCLSTSHRMAFSFSWTWPLSWHVHVSLPSLSKHTEPIRHHCHRYTCSTINGTRPFMNFSRLTSFRSEKLNHRLQVLFRPVWTDSRPDTPFLMCATKLSAPASRPAGCTVLLKCLLVCLTSQVRSCAIFTATALRTWFNWTCLVLSF